MGLAGVARVSILFSAFCLSDPMNAEGQMFIGLSTETLSQPIQDDCGKMPCPAFDCTAELDLEVCSLYADFDDGFPNVKLISVTFSDITAGEPFYQHPFGLDLSPSCQFIPVFPDLQCDSFVTVGRVNSCSGDVTVVDDDFSFLESQVVGGWFNSDVANDQGHPQPGPGGDHQVLLARFSVPQNSIVGGDVIVSWQAPDGGPVVFSESAFQCFGVVLGDLDGDGEVGSQDLALLLGSWGPCPDPTDCPADLDHDGLVGPDDIAVLLGAWG